MRIRVSLPDHLVAFADEQARRRRTTRSGLLARLLRAELVRHGTTRYLDVHGWDVTVDEEAWRSYQRNCMAEEYCDDEW
jgi:metal-responsive CopG/Arc/MetJ family transcriptional regulator